MTEQTLQRHLLTLINHPDPRFARDQTLYLLLEYIGNARISHLVSTVLDSTSRALEEGGC